MREGKIETPFFAGVNFVLQNENLYSRGPESEVWKKYLKMALGELFRRCRFNVHPSRINFKDPSVEWALGLHSRRERRRKKGKVKMEKKKEREKN